MYCATRVCDHLPAGPDDEHRHEAVEQDEQHRDAVDAEVIVDVEARDPLGAARRTASPTWTCRNAGTAESSRGSRRARPTSAIQRAKPASRSRPTAEHGDAGDDRHPDGERQVGRGHRCPTLATRRRASSDAPPVEQPEDADDHHERVVVDVAGLDAPESAPTTKPTSFAEPLTIQPSMIVRSPTFDAKRPSQRDAAGEEPVVEAVEVVLVVEQRVDRPEARGDPRRQRRD